MFFTSDFCTRLAFWILRAEWWLSDVFAIFGRKR